ncbi:ead/Ea22-like family protein [Salmonella enterica]|nr:hypothetical protein [Salmonella enterica subsp. diarizonae]EDY0792875.1 hypothetical protein [Salmonella enterica subsp. diarizonae]EJP5183577.1 ead/Ea22-like family protein [Salmonella enterica]
MSRIDKQALREAAEKADSGEWSYEEFNRLDLPGGAHININGRDAIYCLKKPVGGVEQSRAVMAYIAAFNPKVALALLDECAALAAENAGLKDALNDILQPDAAVLERNHRVRALDAMESPATDAFLAEVRASELDSLAGVAETMLVKFSNQSCSSDMHEVVGWKMVLQQATNRAAQLRKGVQS